jgi:tellurium resistance protein TerZ
MASGSLKLLAKGKKKVFNFISTHIKQLKMGSINLEKGQKINLTKEDGSELKRVFLGLGWDAAGGGFFGGGGGSIDLDASCALFTEGKEFVDSIWFGKLTGGNGSIRHSGDNLTGAGDGDDEVINVDLQTVPERVKSIVFTINSYRGQTFDKVKNCFARLVDSVTGNEICIYKLSEKGSHTGMIMCKLYRHDGKWKMAAMGTPCNGRTIQNISTEIEACL